MLAWYYLVFAAQCLLIFTAAFIFLAKRGFKRPIRLMRKIRATEARKTAFVAYIIVLLIIVVTDFVTTIAGWFL